MKKNSFWLAFSIGIILAGAALVFNPFSLTPAAGGRAASMMPMGTPPNAIVYGSGYIQLKDMMKADFVMNIVSIMVITLFSWFVLPLVMSVV